MYCSTKYRRGFTLLEMIVVLLIVSLISALLMQGFLYMAGVFQVVDRRQQLSLTNRQVAGWLGDSVRGLINGVDVPEAHVLRADRPFSGDAQGFEGLALQALSSAGGVVRPLIVEWRLEAEGQSGLQLVYRERRPEREAADSFVALSWSRAQGRFSYLSNGQWYPSFPHAGLGSNEYGRLLLPDAIRVEVDSPRAPFSLVMRPGSGRLTYQPPRSDAL